MNETAPMPRIDIVKTVDDFEIAAAQAVLAAITEALHERGKCLIALSGGSTPRSVYRHLGNLLLTQAVDLQRLFIIFVDERMVPPDDSASNYGMVKRELLSQVAVPPLHVQRIRGEATPDAAALEYEQEIEKTLSPFSGRCDVILLGVGEDGHTASLFPGTEVLREHEHKVQAVFVPQLNSWRVTLTLPVINRSRAVLFLVTGERKATIVGKILTCTHSNEDIPATMVRPDMGTIRWMLDMNAASQVPSERKLQGNNS